MITATDYSYRRTILTEKAALPIVLSAYHLLQAKSDMAYPFVQESNFYYLTGIREAGWKLLYDGHIWHLVKPAISPTNQLFNGSIGIDVARATSGIESVLTSYQYHDALRNLRQTHSRIATLGDDPYKKYYEFSLNPSQQLLRRMLKRYDFEMVDCRSFLQQMRAVKSDNEIAVQRQAIDLSTKTFAEVKKQINTFHHEYEIEAVFNSAFRVSGAGGHAYEPIVASGANACTLHYSANQARLPKNGLVLMDIGAQVDGYTADITRTYAIGTPTEREREVHRAVVTAQERIVATIKPGVSLQQYQKTADTIMRATVYELGLSKQPADTASFRRYFPHAISHGLGIDVHESLGGFATFKEGMILTVEPGIYIPEENIGIRIEDDILVTATGNENMSASLSTSL